MRMVATSYTAQISKVLLDNTSGRREEPGPGYKFIELRDAFKRAEHQVYAHTTSIGRGRERGACAFAVPYQYRGRLHQ